MCNRALIISEGKILVDSTPSELIARAPNHNVIRIALDEPSEELIETITGQEWCGSVERPDETSLDVVPADGENHLPDLLEILEDVPVNSVHLQEGRFDELFRNLTQGVVA